MFVNLIIYGMGRATIESRVVCKNFGPVADFQYFSIFYHFLILCCLIYVH